DVDLQKHRRMVGRPASRLRIDALETHRPQVELLDESLDHPYRIVIRHVIIDTLGQQTNLGPVHTFDESLHRARPAAFDAVFYRRCTFLHRLGRLLPDWPVLPLLTSAAIPPAGLGLGTAEIRLSQIF